MILRDSVIIFLTEMIIDRNWIRYSVREITRYRNVFPPE
jgi:hypothetical protein